MPDDRIRQRARNPSTQAAAVAAVVADRVLTAAWGGRRCAALPRYVECPATTVAYAIPTLGPRAAVRPKSPCASCAALLWQTSSECENDAQGLSHTGALSYVETYERAPASPDERQRQAAAIAGIAGRSSSSIRTRVFYPLDSKHQPQHAHCWPRLHTGMAAAAQQRTATPRTSSLSAVQQPSQYGLASRRWRCRRRWPCW